MYHRHLSIIAEQTKITDVCQMYIKGPKAHTEYDVLALSIPVSKTDITLTESQTLHTEFEFGPVVNTLRIKQGYLAYNQEGQALYIPEAKITTGLANTLNGKTLVVVYLDNAVRGYYFMAKADWIQINDAQTPFYEVFTLADTHKFKEGHCYNAYSALDESNYFTFKHFGKFNHKHIIKLLGGNIHMVGSPYTHLETVTEKLLDERHGQLFYVKSKTLKNESVKVGPVQWQQAFAELYALKHMGIRFKLLMDYKT